MTHPDLFELGHLPEPRYGIELRPVITTGAEIMDELFGAS
jgi:hypothetical protein